MGQGRDNHCHHGGVGEWLDLQGKGGCRNRAGRGEYQGKRVRTGIAGDACVGIPRDAPAGVEKAVWEKGWEQGASQPTALLFSASVQGKPLAVLRAGIQALLESRCEQRSNMSHPVPQVCHKGRPPDLCQSQTHLGPKLPENLEAELSQAVWQEQLLS